MPRQSIKRTLISKANTQIVVVTSVACFIVIFSIVASTTLIGQLKYQNRVIDAKKSALTQLKTDIQAIGSLEQSYNTFVGASQNIIGGSSTGTGPRDGDNAKIVLDSLPGKYDFPALATSLESLLTSQGVTIESINGTDDSASQQNQASSDPTPQPMPFQISVSGSYAALQNVESSFEASIRPIQVQTMMISGDQTQLTLSITAQTYYQPDKNLNITTEVVK
jgi:hypothetical protein